MAMEDLYQEIIMDHSRAPHHAGLREPFDSEAHQVNPTCGDEITLRVTLGGNGAAATVDDVSYDALGCSISQAAASVMSDLVIGEPLAQAQRQLAAFETMITSKGDDPGDEDLLGDGVAFAGVARYPNRVKCALLGWKAFKLAAAQASADIESATNDPVTQGPVTHGE